MGYMTEFTLEVEGDLTGVELALENISQFECLKIIYWGDTHTMKWYGWEQDMRTLSEMFPNAVFHLSGEGEESGDLWKADFKGGKMQLRTGIITYPPFDKTWESAK